MGSPSGVCQSPGAGHQRVSPATYSWLLQLCQPPCLIFFSFYIVVKKNTHDMKSSLFWRMAPRTPCLLGTPSLRLARAQPFAILKCPVIRYSGQSGDFSCSHHHYPPLECFHLSQLKLGNITLALSSLSPAPAGL